MSLFGGGPAPLPDLLDVDGTPVDPAAAVERVRTGWAREHDGDPVAAVAVVHGAPALLLSGP